MADFHKAIAKAIKAKGLQKLRFWCELCHKQCRDACGYKNHCTTEGHLRRVRVFSQNPNMFLDQYSREFEKTFMDLVRRRFRFKSILAKRVYNEFIQDREHVHMNATRWETLTEFVLYLGKAGLCEVTNTEQGLVIRYIDRDPARKASQEAMRMREKEELNAEQRRQKRLEAQMRAYKELYGEEGDAEAVAGEEEEDPEGSPPEKKVCPATESEEPKTGAEPSVCFSICQPKPVVKQPPLLSLSAAPSAPAPAPTTLDELRIEQERRKEQLGRRDDWLHVDIVVKIMNKEVGDGAFYRRKAVVERVLDKYLAVVKLLDGPERLKIDQDDLETVLPHLDGDVLVVNGAYRGERAALKQCLLDEEAAVVLLKTGASAGSRVVKGYDDISKAYDREGAPQTKAR